MIGFGRDEYYLGRRRRRSIVLPAFMSAAVFALGIVFFVFLRPTVSGSVVDAYSGEPVRGVKLTVGQQRAETDRRGRFTLAPVREPARLVLEPSEGHAGAAYDLAPGTAKGLTFTLRPTAISGTILHKDTASPLPGIVVRAIGPDGAPAAQATTDAGGRYHLADLPGGAARLIAEGPGFARKEIALVPGAGLDLTLRPDTIGGVVRASDGKPVPKATVAMAGVATTTGADGAYTLAGIPDDARVVVKASGYAPQERTPGEARTLDFRLEPLVVKGIYLTPDALLDDDRFEALLALADRTEINAMVLDFKDESGRLFHASPHPLANAIGAVRPAYDLRERLARLREHDIYAIARIVCMQDHTLAYARPDLAVLDRRGGVWENDNGAAWVNAMLPEVWGYNIELAVEAAELGFDEIQYDYVRFPSDGDVDAIEVGTEYTAATRTDAIYGFLTATQEALAPRGVPLAIDIFGIALWDQHDNGIGQQLERLAPVVDYLNPMIYPSHFSTGWFGVERPNDHPYLAIMQSLRAGGERMEQPQRKQRPWLQDFSYGRGAEYGPDQVRAQIQATYDYGATGWLLWNAKSIFTEDALLPEPR